MRIREFNPSVSDEPPHFKTPVCPNLLLLLITLQRALKQANLRRTWLAKYSVRPKTLSPTHLELSQAEEIRFGKILLSQKKNSAEDTPDATTQNQAAPVKH